MNFSFHKIVEFISKREYSIVRKVCSFYPEFLSNIEMFQKIPLLVGYERELGKNIENSFVKQVASISETILNLINPRNIES